MASRNLNTDNFNMQYMHVRTKLWTRHQTLVCMCMDARSLAHVCVETREALVCETEYLSGWELAQRVRLNSQELQEPHCLCLPALRFLSKARVLSSFAFSLPLPLSFPLSPFLIEESYMTKCGFLIYPLAVSRYQVLYQVSGPIWSQVFSLYTCWRPGS